MAGGARRMSRERAQVFEECSLIQPHHIVSHPRIYLNSRFCLGGGHPAVAETRCGYSPRRVAAHLEGGHRDTFPGDAVLVRGVCLGVLYAAGCAPDTRSVFT